MNSLLRVLRECLSPADGAPPGRPLLVAQVTLQDFLRRNELLPPGVSTSPRPAPKHRVAVRGANPYRETARATAHWPQENLIEAVVPILICPVAGQADFRLSDYSLHLPPGQFCLLPPQVPRTDGSHSHIEGRDQNETCDLFWLRPREAAMECWVCHSRGAEHLGGVIGRPVHMIYRDAIPHFDLLLREATEQASGWEKVCESLITIMLTVVQRRLSTNDFHGPAWLLPDSPKETNIVASAQRYMQENLQEPLTIEHVARACYVSRTHLTTQFRERTNQSFNKYLTQLRLERARKLLRETDWSVRAIAYMTGVTPAHLRELFVKHHGVSPRAFRRQAK